ncbi:MAG: chemotaxis protein CheW [Deltaproteobacteria bacterium]|nr:chemotaxis protein CheW [Deltaproteobacteria bacterium]
MLLLVFKLDEQSYALRLSVVEKIIRAVAVTALPRKPEVVLGVIGVHGRIVPVVDIRKRFRLLEREMQLSDQMIIASTAHRTLALLVDSTAGVVQLSEEEMVGAAEIVPNLGYVEGAVRLEDGIVLIHDLDRFLSLEEEKALGASLDTEA